MKRLILASSSPQRLKLLRQIGVEPAAVYTSNVDETPLKGERPRQLAQRLALIKAHVAYAAHANDSLILAADTVVAVGRKILPKAADIEEARAFLKLLSGRTHKVHTALCLLETQEHAMVQRKTTAYQHLTQKCVTSRVTFAALTPTQIDAYLDSEEWQGKAGAYAIQGLAAAFITRLVGSYSAVVGLPLELIAPLLNRHAYPLYDSWSKKP
ncbi:Maf family protein [Bartonella sp. DGB2]|uniref:Maf family protein n=1 Tax=Bartonella sp. DGB2 TaxID=3388426 RepID=UPI00398FBDB0